MSRGGLYSGKSFQFMTSQFLEIELFETWEEFLPIDAMGIKLRAIHTGLFSEELMN